jgi:predicted NBD/HSP70 family sugar kinase
MAAALDKVVARSRIERDKVLIVSISSKGLVHPSVPSLVWSPVFGMRSVDFADLLGPGWQASVVLNNETLLVATALSEKHAPGEAGEPALAALSLGHSIGLGVARLSATGAAEILAPNFGHMLHAPGGALCRCGTSGCIEAYAGFYAILRAAFEAPADRIPAKFVPLAEIEKIASRARQGHRMARRAFRQAGIALGNGLSRLTSLYGAMPVFITGPGTRYWDLLEEGLSEGLAQTLGVRLEGMPVLTVVPDEAALVFAGHLSVAFARVDHEVLNLVGRPRQIAV